MTDDLRKLAEALCHRLRNTPPNVLKEREAADTIDRLTAENAAQRTLLEQAWDALERVTESETLARKMLVGIVKPEHLIGFKRQS